MISIFTTLYFLCGLRPFSPAGGSFYKLSPGCESIINGPAALFNGPWSCSFNLTGQWPWPCDNYTTGSRPFNWCGSCSYNYYHFSACGLRCKIITNITSAITLGLSAGGRGPIFSGLAILPDQHPNQGRAPARSFRIHVRSRSSGLLRSPSLKYRGRGPLF